jgi:hypothetical protein
MRWFQTQTGKYKIDGMAAYFWHVEFATLSDLLSDSYDPKIHICFHVALSKLSARVFHKILLKLTKLPRSYATFLV